MTVDLELPEGGDFPAPSSGDMTCLRCSRSIHTQHPRRCSYCHQARGLCHACYARSRADGTIERYPPLLRSEPIRRDCVHGGIHQHGTPGMYLQDRCRCLPCRHAKSRDVARYRVRRYTTGPGSIDPTGTRRRLQALVTIGWSFTELARRTGIDAALLRSICRNERRRLQRKTADRVAAVYDQLSMTPRVSSTSAERVSVTKTLAFAAAQSWAKPLEWDEGAIDDPAATPYAGRDDQSPTGRRLARIEDYHDLRDKGLTDADIAHRWGITDEGMDRWLYRNIRTDKPAEEAAA